MFTFPVGFFNFIVSSGGGGTTDPYAANVVLFLKGDGTNGSTSIVDSSPSPKTISVFGNAQISTAQSKYGGSSLYFEGNGNNFGVGADILTTPASSDFNFTTRIYTIETWVYIAGDSLPDIDGGRDAIIVNNFPNSNSITGWSLAVAGDTTSTGTRLAFNYAVNSSFNRKSVTVAISKNAQHHVGFCQNNNTGYFFLDGTVYSVDCTGFNPPTSTNPLKVGGLNFEGYGLYLNGYLDSVRITKNVCRYTSNFNPETDTYLNSSSETTDPYGNNVVLFLKGDGTNGSTNIVDSSAYNRTVTTSTATISTIQSKYGNSSIYFNGTQFIRYSWDTLFNISNTVDWTIEGWFYSESSISPGGLGSIICSANSSGSDSEYSKYFRWIRNNAGDNLFGSLKNGEAETILSSIFSPSSELGIWVHKAISHKADSSGLTNGTTRLFKNGILVQSSSTVFNFNGTIYPLLQLGFNSNSGEGGWNYKGWIDSFRYTKACRYTSNFNPETDTYLNSSSETTDPYFSDVQLLLKFAGANNSTTFTDLSNNNYSITVGGNSKISTAQSVFDGSSALFDGNGDYLRINGNSNLQLANKKFTLESFIYPVSPIGSYPNIFDSRNTLAAKGYTAYIDHTDGKLYVLIGDSNTGSWNITLASTSVISTSTFTYFAVTRSANVTNPSTHSDWKLSINGSVQSSQINIANFVVDDDVELFISGYRTNNGNFNGYIGAVRLTTNVVRDVSTIPSSFPSS